MEDLKASIARLHFGEENPPARVGTAFAILTSHFITCDHCCQQDKLWLSFPRHGKHKGIYFPVTKILGDRELGPGYDLAVLHLLRQAKGIDPLAPV